MGFLRVGFLIGQCFTLHVLQQLINVCISHYQILQVSTEMFTMSRLIKLIFCFPLTIELCQREQQQFWGSVFSDSQARPVPWAVVAACARGGS